MQVDTKYIKKFGNQLKQIQNDIGNGYNVIRKTDRILFKGANDITNDIKRSMRDTKRAKHFYKRGRKKHFPSEKGNPPAIDSGQLLRNTMFDFKPLQVEVGYAKNAPYGKFLEKGTKKMDERPAIQPAVNKNKSDIFDNIMKIIPDFMATVFRGVR